MRKSQFCSSSVFLSFFFSDKHSSKTIRACVNIIHTKRLLYYRTSSFSGLVQRTSYDWRATAKKRSPSMQDERVRRLLGLLFTQSGCGSYSQATPGLLNACVLQCATSLAGNFPQAEVGLQFSLFT